MSKKPSNQGGKGSSNGGNGGKGTKGGGGSIPRDQPTTFGTGH